MKPLVDDAYDAVCMEYNRELQEGKTKDKKPERVTTWIAVVKEQFTQESEDVKLLVRKATQDYAKKIKAFDDGLPENEDQKSARREA